MLNRIFFSVLLPLFLFLSCAGELEEKIDITINGHPFTVEVARSSADQARGLMYRTSLEPGTGMLFVYKQYTDGAFWMKNVPIPLSIAFLADTGKIVDIKEMTPQSKKRIYSRRSYIYTLELGGGVYKKLGIKPGDFVIFPEGFK